MRMDSDSESQDSDDGRRFRFEATRKIAHENIHNSGNKSTSSRDHNNDRRSRSRDRSSRRDRKDERGSNEHTKKEGTSSRDDTRSSKDRKNSSKDDSRRRDRDMKYNHREAREGSLRHDSRSRDRRDSKSRDEKQHAPRRRSRERSHEKMRHDYKCRDKREKNYSRDRSGQREKTHDDNCSTDNRKKNEGAATRQECKDLNLSDFDIVSDADGDSDALEDFLDNRGEEKVKNRKNGDKSSRPKNSNNPHALSDLLLENASTSASSTCNYNSSNEQKHDSNKHNGDESSFGPELPPSKKDMPYKLVDNEASQSKMIGPCLPDEYRKYISRSNEEINEEETENPFGPALPPHLMKPKFDNEKLIGPVLPQKPNDDGDDNEMEVENIEDEEIEEFDAFGPMPMDHPDMKTDKIQQQLEYRAKLIKKELAKIDGVEEKKREEWMTELPEVQTGHLALTARKFRSREGPDMSDRSSWTDTPADRAQKRIEQMMGKKTKDHRQEMEAPIVKPRERHEKSLLELHQKKLKKKKKKEEKAAKETGAPVRRPFDRDIDLKANHFDESRKKRFMMTATTLDDRFSHGKI